MIFLLYLKCIACKCAAASICRLEPCVKDFLGLFEMAIDSHFLLHWFQYMFFFFFQLELSSVWGNGQNWIDISLGTVSVFHMRHSLNLLLFVFFKNSLFCFHLFFSDTYCSQSGNVYHFFVSLSIVMAACVCVCVYTVFTLYLKSTTPSLCTHKLRWFPL